MKKISDLLLFHVKRRSNKNVPDFVLLRAKR